MILLFSLPLSYDYLMVILFLWLSCDYFDDTLLYRQDNLSSEDVKKLLNTSSENHNNDHAYGMIERGRTDNNSSGNEEKFSSKKVLKN